MDFGYFPKLNITGLIHPHPTADLHGHQAMGFLKTENFGTVYAVLKLRIRAIMLNLKTSSPQVTVVTMEYCAYPIEILKHIF